MVGLECRGEVKKQDETKKHQKSPVRKCLRSWDRTKGRASRRPPATSSRLRSVCPAEAGQLSQPGRVTLKG